MGESPDADIIAKIKQGDGQVFRELFDAYYAPLCYFANKYVGDMDMARSLVQEVFVKLWTNHDHLLIAHSVKSYLYHSVKNQTINFLKQEKGTIRSGKFDAGLQVEPFRDVVQESELQGIIQKTISQLPEKCREIFLLSRTDELKYTEIAHKLNISVKTVEMQMGIALKRLREKLSGYQSFNLLCLLFRK